MRGVTGPLLFGFFYFPISNFPPRPPTASSTPASVPATPAIPFRSHSPQSFAVPWPTLVRSAVAATPQGNSPLLPTSAPARPQTKSRNTIAAPVPPTARQSRSPESAPPKARPQSAPRTPSLSPARRTIVPAAASAPVLS